MSCSRAFNAVAGVLNTMFAEVSSIHSIRLGGSEEKCSDVKVFM